MGKREKKEPSSKGVPPKLEKTQKEGTPLPCRWGRGDFLFPCWGRGYAKISSSESIKGGPLLSSPSKRGRRALSFSLLKEIKGGKR